MTNFLEIEDTIPYVLDGDKHSVELYVFDDVRVKLPGKHADETRGGDFVVETYLPTNAHASGGMRWVQMTHEDYVLEATRHPANKDLFLSAWRSLLLNADIEDYADMFGPTEQTLLRSLLCIGVCESRRYGQHEPIGGRFLLYNFAKGVREHGWPHQEVRKQLRYGKNGLRYMGEKWTQNATEFSSTAV